MHVFYQPELPEVLHLPEEEAKHCLRVLRHKAGDLIHVTDGRGNLYAVRITNELPKKASFEIIQTLQSAQEKEYSIHIAIAPTKNSDRLEWFLEKAIEFGIDKITLLQCRHSERTRINLERLQKKAVSAMKQSLNFTAPELEGPVPFPEFIERHKQREPEAQNFIAYVDERIPQHLKDAAKKGGATCVLIGPEGDFAGEEIELAIQAGFSPVSLGKSRLRTETAGLSACHILNLINE